MAKTSYEDPVVSKIANLADGGLAQALDSSDIGLWLWDLEQDTLELSQGLLRLTGFETLPGQTRHQILSGLLHPDDLQQTIQRTRRLFEEGKPYETICRMRHISGRYSWALTHGNLVRDETDAPTHMIGVVRVLDDLEQVKRDLRRSEEIARLGHWDIDVTSNNLSWSEGAYRLFDFDPTGAVPSLDEARSKYPPEDRTKIMSIIDQALITKEPFEYQTRILRNDKADRHVRVRGAVETGTNGDAVAYFGTIQDISDEVERDAQIRQAQKLESIGKLTGGIAHDFNNLLAVILGNLELLKQDQKASDAGTFIDAAIQATLRGSGLTQNMLSFARRAELEPSRQDLNVVLRTTQSWITRTIPENIEVTTNLQPDLWPVEVDQNSLENAILNLILNARDAMPQGGTLHLRTENIDIPTGFVTSLYEDIPPGSYVVLSIRDTGHGIPQEILSDVFEPFFTTKETGRGSGMGLSMVQGFVKQSGGSLLVDSKVNSGTTFRLYFHAARNTETPLEACPGAHASHIASTKHKASILLVEDEEDVLRVLKAILTSAGFDVTPAANGDQALDIFRSQLDFDLLLTDISMPGKLNGIALAAQTRTIRPDLPVVFLSGYAGHNCAPDDGMSPNDIRLTKPARKKDLIQAIEQTLDLPVSTAK